MHRRALPDASKSLALACVPVLAVCSTSSARSLARACARVPQVGALSMSATRDAAALPHEEMLYCTLVSTELCKQEAMTRSEADPAAAGQYKALARRLQLIAAMQLQQHAEGAADLYIRMEEEEHRLSYGDTMEEFADHQARTSAATRGSIIHSLSPNGAAVTPVAEPSIPRVSEASSLVTPAQPRKASPSSDPKRRMRRASVGARDVVLSAEYGARHSKRDEPPSDVPSRRTTQMSQAGSAAEESSMAPAGSGNPSSHGLRREARRHQRSYRHRAQQVCEQIDVILCSEKGKMVRHRQPKRGPWRLRGTL